MPERVDEQSSVSSPASHSVSAPVSRGLLATIARLRALLEKNDTEAMHVIGLVTPSDLDADAGRALKEVRTQIENFDFAEALSSLDKLEALVSRQAGNEGGRSHTP